VKILYCRRKSICPCFIVVSFFLFLPWGAIAYGADAFPSGPGFLLEKYHAIEKELEKGPGQARFHVESSVNQNAAAIDIYGTVKYPFHIVQSELMTPPNWCQIILSHPDIRACTYKGSADTWFMNVYNVRTYPETIDKAYQLKFVYRLGETQPGYFQVGLLAKEGPSNTSDHRFGLEAIPLGKKTTFIHFRYSFGYNALGYYVMKIFGGSKIGFSVIGTDSAGNPVYVEQLRGAAERDVVFHYLAILAYLDTRKAPSVQREDRRFNKYFDLTMLFKKQLFQMERQKYLAYKRQDRESQKRLQDDLHK
jgi:hypothetical protein